jgi:beta-carotene 15,15'-dioxygenase
MPTGLSRPVSFFYYMRHYLHTYLPYLLPAILLLLLKQITLGFNLTTQLVLLAVAMTTTGIPHGALDYLIFRQQEQSAGRQYSLFRFLCYYLGLMIFYALFWWINPGLSLLLFLLISSWHFADNDLSALPLHHKADNLIRIAFGGWLLLVLIFSHTSELMVYLQQIVGTHNFLVRFAKWYQPYEAVVFWMGLPGWILILWMRLRRQGVMFRQFYSIITLMLLLFLCRQLPLIVGFAVYFAIWHSLQSFRSIWLYLRRNNNLFRSVRQLVVPGLPFVLGAFCGLLLFFFWSNAAPHALTPLWIFLSLITLPHGLLMHEVFVPGTKKEQAL